MKKFIIICLILLFPSFLYGTDQDTLYIQMENPVSLQQQITQLEEQIDSLQKQIIEIEPLRSYTSILVMIILGVFVFIGIFLGILVPANLKKEMKELKKKVLIESEEKDEKIRGTMINTYRTLYKISKPEEEKDLFMQIVWCGRWLCELSKNKGADKAERLISDMNVHLRDTKSTFDTLNEDELKRFANFENLGGVKENYYTLAGFSDLEIQKNSTYILNKINEIKEEYSVDGGETELDSSTSYV